MKQIKSGYFRTYVSTSWSKYIAKSFIRGKQGMIIEIDEKYKNDKSVKCCDVSWISRFGYECEILFARSKGDKMGGSDKFSCIVLDESNGVQTVSLRKAEEKINVNDVKSTWQNMNRMLSDDTKEDNNEFHEEELKQAIAMSMQHDVGLVDDDEDEEVWQCSICTFNNNILMKVCEMCENPKGN